MPHEEAPNHTFDFFYEFPIKLRSIIDKNVKNQILKPNEIKIAECLLCIMNDWEDMYREIIDSGGVKFNKSLINDSIREMTGLSIKDVRDGIKKLKMIYFEEKVMLIKRKESDF